MNDLTNYNSRVYTDIQGLHGLKYESNTPAAKKEVAEQFEAILMQMVMHSMRDANKAFASDLFGTQQMDIYQDMFDKQLSLLMSNSNLGFAKMVEQNIDHLQSPGKMLDATPPTYSSPVPAAIVEEREIKQQPAILQQILSSHREALSRIGKFSSPEEFVRQLWPLAKFAANAIGAKPEILLAQAALETNWGKSVISRSNNDSTHNLFNIKADTSWNNKTATVDSLEQINGVLVKEKSSYRSYDSYIDSFMDYVNFLRQNNRYSAALQKVDNSEQFIHALQAAGYATDQQYGDKIMKIYGSSSFQGWINKAKINDLSFSEK